MFGVTDTDILRERDKMYLYQLPGQGTGDIGHRKGTAELAAYR